MSISKRAEFHFGCGECERVDEFLLRSEQIQYLLIEITLIVLFNITEITYLLLEFCHIILKILPLVVLAKSVIYFLIRFRFTQIVCRIVRTVRGNRLV